MLIIIFESNNNIHDFRDKLDKTEVTSLQLSAEHDKSYLLNLSIQKYQHNEFSVGNQFSKNVNH